MTKYSDSQKASEPDILREAKYEAKLEFPDGRDFNPVLDRSHVPSNFYEVCTEYLIKLKQRPDFWQRRKENRCYAEFDLYHPERTPATYDAELLDYILKGVI